MDGADFCHHGRSRSLVTMDGAAGGVKDLEHHPGSLPRTGMRTTNIPILYLTVNQSVT